MRTARATVVHAASRQNERLRTGRGRRRPPPKQIRFDSVRDEVKFYRQKGPATSNMAQATSTSVAPCVRDTALEGERASRYLSTAASRLPCAPPGRARGRAGAQPRPACRAASPCRARACRPRRAPSRRRCGRRRSRPCEPRGPPVRRGRRSPDQPGSAEVSRDQPRSAGISRDQPRSAEISVDQPRFSRDQPRSAEISVDQPRFSRGSAEISRDQPGPGEVRPETARG